MSFLLLVLFAAGVVFFTNPLWVNDQVVALRLWRAGVHSHYATVDGNRIHYLEAKPGADGRTLVLVHGLGARAEDWAPLIPRLKAQGYHVYALDLLGYGRSARPADADYSVSLEEKTVVDFMQTLHLDHAIVGGWSMGGWVVLKLALDHPELADTLMVYDSAGVYFPPTWAADLFTPSDPAGLFRLQEMLTPAAKPLPGFVGRDAIRKLQRNAWIVNRSLASMTAGRDLLDFRLHSLKQPTLLMWGGEDRLIPPATGEAMQREIPHAELAIVPGCGHLAPSECSGAVFAGTLKFLKAGNTE
ncbi:alpha/beta fold hydrolase [Granulicella rosea]|nr:alpha/beta hydrolase [Granulicella rosea]